MDALMLPSNWKRVRLGDILTLKHGRDYKKFKLGNIPVYGSGGYMLSINNFLHNGESVCIGRKGTIDKPIYLNGKFWVVDTLFYSYSFKKSIPKFIFYAFSIIKWSNYNEATGVPSLTKMTISNIEIPLPPLNEQIAIANILSALDHYLYTLDALILKKESVKKALSFELLSQRKRLKGFNQAWQKVRLGDILSYEQPTKFLVATTQYLQKGFTPILTAGKTFILGYTNDKHGIYTNIPVIIFDDFTTDSKMVNFPFKVKSSAIKILSLRDNNQADLKYIYEKLTLLKHQVTDHKRYWIDEFSNIEIPLPPLNEQIAIANILSDLDSEIISLKNKKRQFDNIKKALNHDLMSAKIRVLKK
ncbi:restriction endonuclease subunit S [Helicobacter pylori]|uniref:restriction endonuclease subunit S n=1 Tax=Helicobacter pylori TaxID=210 RepID=UPI000EAF4F04|nr:restriction endonuclease subunit S [Helicobacter pylori]